MSDLKDKFDDAKDEVKEKADEAKIRLDKAVDDVKYYAHEAGEDIKNTGETAKEKLSEVNAEKNLTRKVPSLKDVEKWIEEAKTIPRKLQY